MKIHISEQVKSLLPPSVNISEKQITNLKSKGELNTYFVFPIKYRQIIFITCLIFVSP